MTQTQSIIVYRNPLEQAVWESGLVLPLFASLSTFILVFAIIIQLAGEHIQWKSRKTTIIQWAAGIVAAGAAVYVFTFLAN